MHILIAAKQLQNVRLLIMNMCAVFVTQLGSNTIFIATKQPGSVKIADHDYECSVCGAAQCSVADRLQLNWLHWWKLHEPALTATDEI